VPGLAIGDWVTQHARYQPRADCIVSPDGTTLTYGETDAQVTRLAWALRAAGLRPGDRIGILATDSPEYVITLLASMKLGTTFVAINFRLSPPEITNLLQAAGVCALFLAGRYRAAAEPARRALGDQLRLVAWLDGGDGTGTSYADLLARAPGADEGEMVSPATDEDILGLALTSGTTGVPKGVLQSQRMIRALVQSGALELGLQPDDLIYSGAPLFHISGIGHFLYGLSRGCASLVLPQFDADTVLRWMQSGRLRHAMLIPSMIISILSHPEVAASSYAGLRSVMYGGSPMPPSVIATMARTFGCDLFNGFGAGTEAGGQTMFRPADHRRALAGDEHLLGSIGRPIYGCDVKLCDADGAEVPDGEVGEIYSRSESVMSGYLDQPELTAGSLRDGWFHAGDLAWRDSGGYLFLAGRADDMIIRGGENVYPVEIEDVVADHPAVLEAAVVGEPDPYWGEVVDVVIRTVTDSVVTLDELREHCRGRLASYKIPQRLIIADELPKNPTGKIRKGELRRAIVTGELA
jgi:acyl-CoA synthetase (AMP-forming)/AMP-acid ligase II